MMLSCLCNVLLIQKQEKKMRIIKEVSFRWMFELLVPDFILRISCSGQHRQQFITELSRVDYNIWHGKVWWFSFQFWETSDTAGEEEVVTWSRGQINYNRNTDSSVCASVLFCFFLLVIRSTTFYIISIITSWQSSFHLWIVYKNKISMLYL